MTLLGENGASSPLALIVLLLVRDIVQRWRISVASLLLFTILATFENCGSALKLASPWIYRDSHSNGNNFYESPSSYMSVFSYPQLLLKKHQCLSLQRQLSKEICDLPVTRRISEMRRVSLNFCSLHPIYSIARASDSGCMVDGSPQQCRHCLNWLEGLDLSANQMFCGFHNVVDRFDCDDIYSVKWNCTLCKEAYRNWLCTTLIPFYLSDTRVRPCSEFCNSVEETCPFLRTQMLETHAGDPTFICKDESCVTCGATVLHHLCDKDPQISPDNSMYGVEPACYKLCHLDSNYGNMANAGCNDINLDANSTTSSSSSSRPVATAATALISVHSLLIPVYYSSTLPTSIQSLIIVHCVVWWLLRTLLPNLDIGLT